MNINNLRVNAVDVSDFSPQELKSFIRDQNLAQESNLYTNSNYLAMWNKYLRHKKCKFLIFQVFEKDQIVGLVPTQFSSNYFLKKFSSPGVMFGYPDFLATRGNRDAVIEAFIFHLNKQYRFFTADLFRSRYKISTRANLRFVKVYEKNDAPYIKLEDFINPISSKLTKSIQYSFRRLKSKGLKVEHFLDFSKTNNLSYLLSKIVEFHTQNWPNSIFKRMNENYSEFIHNLLMIDLEDLRAVISTITVEEEVAAAHLGFYSDSTFYYWLPVINPKFSKFSPGQMLIRELLQFAKDNDLEIFDFMNDLEPYKLKWTGTVGTRFGIEICSHSFLQSKYKKYYTISTWMYLLDTRKMAKLFRHPKRTISRFISG